MLVFVPNAIYANENGDNLSINRTTASGHSTMENDAKILYKVRTGEIKVSDSPMEPTALIYTNICYNCYNVI